MQLDEANTWEVGFSTPGDRELKRNLLGEGPWVDEPDRVEWRHQGLPCLILRGPMGALNGYVAIPYEHVWYGLHRDRIDVSVHGGITYNDHNFGAVSYVPKRGESPRVWWIGFDCIHGTDRIPQVEQLLFNLRGVPSISAKLNTYRPVAYVRGEVESLAEQATLESNWIEYCSRLFRARTRREQSQAVAFALLTKRQYQKRIPYKRRIHK